MHLPTGQPPGYQRAAWAAAGLQAPPGALVGQTLADSIAFQEALKQSRGEGFLIGAAAATEEARRQDAERDEAVRLALAQAAEAHRTAQFALAAMQQHQNNAQRMQREIEQAQSRIAALEATLSSHESPPTTVVDRAGRGQTDHEDGAEPLSKRLRALNWKNVQK